MCYEMTHHYQDELHRPQFPTNSNSKFDGCPNCCVASIARADMSFIGTWKDDIRIDQKAVKAYIGGEIKPTPEPMQEKTGASSRSKKKSSPLPDRLYVDGKREI